MTGGTSPNSHPRIPRKWIYIGVFLLLALASNAVRLLRNNAGPSPQGRQFAEIYLGEKKAVRLAYREFGGAPPSTPATPTDTEKPAPTPAPTPSAPVPPTPPAAATTPSAPAAPSASTPPVSEKPVFLLLHGAWGSGAELWPIAEKLAAEGFRVFVPDLFGSGASARDLSDFTAENAATIAAAFLQTPSRNVKQAHIVGVGQGGAVAVALAQKNPVLVRSLSLVSSVGAQEFDLLGNHIANSFVFWFHWLFIQAGEVALPHFGVLDNSPLNTRYAAVFRQSDLGGMKEFLGNYTGPLFLAHGEDDWVITADTARYTQKIAPHAKTFFTSGGHRVFEREKAAELAAQLAKFATASTTTTAAPATPAAVPRNAAAMPAPEPAQGARLVILMLIIIVCAFVAEDPTCLASGMLVHLGVIGWFPATLACLISILIGDFTLYLVGYALGRPALRVPPLKWIVPEYKIDRMAGWFEKKGFQGLLLIITSRFIPASRLPTFICAGVMRLSFWRLSILFVVAAAVWAPVMVLGVGWLMETFGWDRDHVIDGFHQLKSYALWIILGALFAFWFLMHVVVPALTWRGRRMLVMKVRHWARHEFWPDSLLYLPVATMVLGAALRRFNFGGVAAANTALGPLGGFTGEAKSTMFSALKNAAPLAKWTLISGGKNVTHDQRVEAVKRFMEENNLAFPIVLKPDAGDRGFGVNRITNEAQAAEWLTHFQDDAIAQEWVGGAEFEVVWCRQPAAAHGRILSVVAKEPVTVTGDGHRLLEDLIWADDRAVSRGDLFLRLNWRRGTEVLAAGEKLVLSHIGTHACGAHIRDRQELRTETLAAALDKIADTLCGGQSPSAAETENGNVAGGLHYVVYDLRVETEEQLREGGRFVVTGVSGVCSVSSRLRDQSARAAYSLASARRQIREAFAAADAVRKSARGQRQVSGLALFAIRAEARSRHIIDLRSE
ncbi:MAG: alpha/beta fold hydrolase [Puniceicoccales bacterium]|jgi:pimeloyl-ACP methyl ester carboxylesterase/membrane protein DedA with SNARE-associated domain|nr:alpha/beta fold hydrolase [Puniceicoccales bacterium]